MQQPDTAVYGSRKCPDTNRATRHLDGHKIVYEFKDLGESPELNDHVADLDGGERVMPTIRVDDRVLINPSEEEPAGASEGIDAHG